VCAAVEQQISSQEKNPVNILVSFRSPQSATARRRAAAACGVLASLVFCRGAAAQFGPIIELPPDLPTVTILPTPPAGYPPTVAQTAAGTYYALPAWSQTPATNARFVILSNFNNDAVLDRATGLVWTRQSVVVSALPDDGEQLCRRLAVGSRMGWRLPAISELLSLMDLTQVPSPGTPRLPAGHPFMVSSVNGDGLFPYAARQRENDQDPNVEVVDFASATVRVPVSYHVGILCVRGPSASGAR
jgi:hypothetical protein